MSGFHGFSRNLSFLPSLILGSVLLLGCDASLPFGAEECTADDDCPEGQYCDQGNCMPIDGDIEGDLPLDGDSILDGDLDHWIELCPEEPFLPALPTPPCQRKLILRVPPPECWRLDFVDDPDQNGDPCYHEAEFDYGYCQDGICIVGVYDGDFEITDGDWEMHPFGCNEMGGQCEDYVGRCPAGTRVSTDSMDCGTGVCCIDLEMVDCYRHDGFCAPYQGDPTTQQICREGYHAAESNAGCSLFNPAFDEWCCLPNPPVCVNEGGRGSRLDDNPDNDHCCRNLQEIPNSFPDSENGCIGIPDGSFFCTHCGNNTCGAAENFCNCPDDCASPGECANNADCPAASCYDIGDWPLFSNCVQEKYRCDAATGQCILQAESFEELVCNYDTGYCEEAVPPLCSSEDTGTCSYYVRGICPDGQELNRYPLGCDELCCLEAECLKQDGYCSIWEGTDCDAGFTAVSGHMGCPGGQSAMCCLPDVSECVTLGSIGMGQDIDCCEGLDRAPYAIVENNGDCAFPNCDCFVCIVGGDDFCDEANQENECNSEDCEGPQPECDEDSDCPDPTCEDVLGDPHNGCRQKDHDCVNGECVAGSELIHRASCDEQTGKCIPEVIPECELQGGQCIYWEDPCPEDYTESPDQLDCDRSSHCCLPDPTTCTPLGGIGWNWVEEACCPGLTAADMADVGPNGECYYYDCACFICLGIGDNFCDGQNGENHCNSDDCPKPPECTGDADCPDPHCQGFSGLPNCIQYSYECVNGECLEQSSYIEDHYCDENFGECKPFPVIECQLEGGYCSHTLAACEEGYYQADSLLGCTGGHNTHCCLPVGPCITEGELGNIFYGNECCEGLVNISNAWPTDVTGECIAVPDGSFYCARCPNNQCGPGENYCNCPEDCLGPVECQVDYDCLGMPWYINCPGHWDCIEGQCSENCGQPCGDGYCDPYAGESADNCFSDCEPECASDIDCLRQDWEVRCYGHWDCQYDQCQEVCGYPCGNGQCEAEAGEGEDNCPEDCQEVECQSNSDCPSPWCHGYDNEAVCTQHTYSCIQGQCDEHLSTYENAYCDASTGYCSNIQPSPCELEGGYCTYYLYGCEAGYYPANSSMGCPGGNNSLCCLPEEPECLLDNDCGEPVCEADQEGTCYQSTPYCDDGECLNWSQIYLNSDCIDGECVPRPDSCEAAGGHCIGWGPECPETHYTDWEHACDYGQCCIPVELGDCLQEGGHCVSPNSPCDAGYSADNETTGCPNNRMMCCLPDPDDCVGLGEIGTMAPGDQCCPGLSEAEYADVGPDGQCYYYECACYICLELDDNFCDGQHGENICNSQDCQSPNECSSDVDCLDRPWIVDCLGHWECTSAGQCAEHCGYPCGNGICEAYEGESGETCPDDCPGQQCSSDDDCMFCEISSTGNAESCVQYKGVCDAASGICQIVEEAFMPDHTCDQQSGTCVPWPDSDCEVYGGVCVNYYGCPPNYSPANMDCDANTHCCMPSIDPDCQTDEDCGDSGCFMSAAGGCTEINNSCENGQCMSSSANYPDAICDENTGNCVEMRPECSDLGGICTSWNYGCPVGYIQEEGSCAGINCAGSCICCVPEDEPVDSCEDQGGVCEFILFSCPTGYQGSGQQMDCGILFTCCLP